MGRPDFDPENFDPASVVENPAITLDPTTRPPDATWRWIAAAGAVWWLSKSKQKLLPAVALWYLLAK